MLCHHLDFSFMIRLGKTAMAFIAANWLPNINFSATRVWLCGGCWSASPHENILIKDFNRKTSIPLLVGRLCFYQNRAFVVAVVICCFRKTVVPSPRFVLVWKVAVYNAKSSARYSIIASTTPICMCFQANGILLELRFRNFPNEHSARVHASFYRISLKSFFKFRQTQSMKKRK